MNNSQNLSQDIIYNVNFSNKISMSNENSITDSLINEIFINEPNSNEQINTNAFLLTEWYQDKIYIAITRIFLSIVLLISIYIFIQYI
jgi:hypothetical protein